MFEIKISSKGNKTSVRFYNGDPFEELYTGKVSQKKTLILFFDTVEGSISFNKANGSNNTNSRSNCKKIKFAECKLLSKEYLQIITFKNNCSLMPHNKKLVLKKLKEKDSCIPK